MKLIFNENSENRIVVDVWRRHCFMGFVCLKVCDFDTAERHNIITLKKSPAIFSNVDALLRFQSRWFFFYVNFKCDKKNLIQFICFWFLSILLFIISAFCISICNTIRWTSHTKITNNYDASSFRKYKNRCCHLRKSLYLFVFESICFLVYMKYSMFIVFVYVVIHFNIHKQLKPFAISEWDYVHIHWNRFA